MFPPITRTNSLLFEAWAARREINGSDSSLTSGPPRVNTEKKKLRQTDTVLASRPVRCEPYPSRRASDRPSRFTRDMEGDVCLIV